MPEVDWDNVAGTDPFGGKIGDNSVRFLRIEPNKRYVVRLVGKARWFWNVYRPKVRRSTVVHVDAIEELRPHLDEDTKPKKRYAINVIDRSDNEIKVMEGPKSLFEEFGEWKKATEKSPGGKEGGDWSITASDGEFRDYKANFLGFEPFSEDEQKRLFKDKEFYDLPKLYEGMQIEAALERLGLKEVSAEPKKSSGDSTQSDPDF